jgi:hypothetical protein
MSTSRSLVYQIYRPEIAVSWTKKTLASIFSKMRYAGSAAVTGVAVYIYN